MRIVYRVSEEDFMEARRLFVKNEKWTRRLSRRIMPWMGGLVLVCAFVEVVLIKNVGEALVMGLFGAYFLYCGFALQRYFRKLYRNDPRYQREITADISEDGVHVMTSTADTQMKWGAIVRFLESDRIFMLFYGEWSFSVVPKSAFAEGGVDIFRDLLRRKVGEPRPS